MSNHVDVTMSVSRHFPSFREICQKQKKKENDDFFLCQFWLSMWNFEIFNLWNPPAVFKKENPHVIKINFIFNFFLLPRWIVGPWESCSVSCGGGVKERRVYCQQGHNNSQVTITTSIHNIFPVFIIKICILNQNKQKKKVDDVICSALIGHKARTHEPCNTHDCPTWFQGPWSQVNLNFLVIVVVVGRSWRVTATASSAI